MRIIDMRPSFHGYSSSSTENWYYKRVWNTMTEAQRQPVLSVTTAMWSLYRFIWWRSPRWSIRGKSPTQPTLVSSAWYRQTCHHQWHDTSFHNWLFL